VDSSQFMRQHAGVVTALGHLARKTATPSLRDSQIRQY
jgi:hypothetical protein